MIAVTTRFPGDQNHGFFLLVMNSSIVHPCFSSLVQNLGVRASRALFTTSLHYVDATIMTSDSTYFTLMWNKCALLWARRTIRTSKKSVIRTRQSDACELQGRKISRGTKAQRQPAIFIYGGRNDADEQGCLFKQACLSKGVSKQQG